VQANCGLLEATALDDRSKRFGMLGIEVHSFLFEEKIIK
jgi:hypothetical protein